MGPFFAFFPQTKEAHKLFSGGPKWGVLGGGAKVYVEKMSVPFLSLISLVSQTIAATPPLLPVKWPIVNERQALEGGDRRKKLVSEAYRATRGSHEIVSQIAQ